jgi:cyclopropane-fatty-acyl-phospholipid synthase
MKNNIRVDAALTRFRPNKKREFLSGLFKVAILKKFENIRFGRIQVTDGKEVYTFGNPSLKTMVNVQVESQEFYILLGSGGLLGAAEAYAGGLWKTDDLLMLIRTIFQNKDVMAQLESGWSKLMKPINTIIHWRRKNSLSGSKQNILAHYDLSNEFYQLWLDETMTYSSGIFQNQSISMKDASIEKLDRICRKLDIKLEDSVLEIGTGWGSFALHAAENYGCHVTTTTISDAQYNFVQNKIENAGLNDKITLLREDYRNLKGQYDKVVSIEMIEAVGHEYVPLYFQKVSSLLKDDGLFGLQGITYNNQNFDVYKRSVDFIKKYIFPGSCLISVSQVTEVMKNYTDLSLSHLEDITMHYATTLKNWRFNFLNEIDNVKNLGFSNEFINMWEFYFVYCEAGFRERNIGDYQFVFSKPAAKNIQIDY